LLFSGHKFPTTNARMPIKGSEDGDFRLVYFQKKETKNLLGLGPRTQCRNKKNLNLPPGPALAGAGPNARPGRGAQCKT